MAPVTRAQTMAELNKELRLVSIERDLLREQNQTLLDETVPRNERDELKAQLDGMRLAYEKLMQEKQSMASQIESLTQQVLQFGPSSTLTRLHINALPDVVQRTIFALLPPKDVLQMGRVCKHWISHQQRIYFKVRSVSLTLGVRVHSTPDDTFDFFINPRLARLVSDEGSAIYSKRRYRDEWCQVKCSSLTMENLLFLSTSLPNVVTLKIVIHRISYTVVDQVIQLLQMLSTKLVTFKVLYSFSEDNRVELRYRVFQLVRAINSMTRLTNLTVHINHLLYRETGADGGAEVNDQFLGALSHFELSILARLKEFNFSSKDRIMLTPLFFSLKQFVPQNTELTHIGIGRELTTGLNKFAELCPTVASRITTLEGVTIGQEAILTISRILSKFVSLTVIGFIVIPSDIFTFSEAINLLSSLKHLVRLGLRLSPVDVPPNLNRLYPLSKDDITPRTQIRRLSSVKILNLTIHTVNRKSDLESCHWGWAFPNVKVLEIRLINCELPEMRQLVPTFVQCAKLRHIYTYEVKKWIEWAEAVKSDGRRTFKVLKRLK